MSTQSVDGAPYGTEVFRSVICEGIDWLDSSSDSEGIDWFDSSSDMGRYTGG